MRLYNKGMDFAPLHLYSGFSFLRSGFPLGKIFRKAKAEGVKYLSFCDYKSISGYPTLYHFCMQEGMHPVFGYDSEIENHGFSLFVKSEEGYKNLLQIVALDSEGKLTWENIFDKDGLCFVYHPDQSPLFTLPLQEGQIAAELAKFSKRLPDFRIGLPFGQPYSPLVKAIREFANKYPYPLIAFPFVRYEKMEDEITLRIVRAIAEDEKLTEKKANGYSYWPSEEEINGFYLREELHECEALISSTSSFEFLKKRGGLLSFPVPEGETPETYLRKKAYEGLAKKNPDFNDTYRKRLEYELGVIHQMGYDSYFLLVADYVGFAKTHGVMVGPGRGSGAGSLVSYALDIVRPDPIKYDLLFERFLNPMRLSMPDIDVDFSDTKRDQVVTYLIDKYGVDHVGHIITMQTLGAKASLRDIGRVFDYPPHDIDVLAKNIEARTNDLRKNYVSNPAFRQIVDSDPYYLEIVSLASKIEGLPRQSGLHAAGIVLNDSPLSSSIPVFRDPVNGSVAAFEMNYLEEQGFLKMDILGLRNLSIVERCLQLVAKLRGIHLDYQEIPYDDPKAISLIGENKTMGLFQLESPGMNRAIAEVKPTTFEDVVAIIALFRPGPMENIPSYGRRKQGREAISYPHPALEEILSSTYGIIIYQEQIMQIVCKLAGFSLGQADLFRRAISKKNTDKLLSLKEEFIQGCIDHGTSKDKATEVFDLIEKFANYGFNKSHALAYGMLTCQMAYLKCYYPQEFYCAILDGTATNDHKFPAMVSEIKRSGLKFEVPHINEASITFLPKKGAIIFPFTAIKGLPFALAKGIVEERSLNGPYGDIFDFALRTKKHGLNQSNLTKLIDAGCFDNIYPGRGSLRLASSSALDYATNFVGENGETIALDLGFAKPEIISIEENRMGDLLAEKEVLGMMVSGSPLESRKEEIKAKKLASITTFLNSRYPLYICGIVSSVKTIITKSGAKMAFLTIYDDDSELELTLFASDYSKAYPLLKEGNAITLLAKKDYFKGRESIVGSNIAAL